MKKIQELSRKKSVRIDAKTVILVDRTVPDHIARQHYLDNIERSAYLIKPHKPMSKRRKDKIEEEELLEEFDLPGEVPDEDDE